MPEPLNHLAAWVALGGGLLSVIVVITGFARMRISRRFGDHLDRPAHVPRITELTPGQESILPAIRDDWIQHGLSTRPADRPAAEAAVRLAYETAGLEPPKIFVWLDSPLAGCIGSWMLAQIEVQVEEQLKAQDQDWAQVWAHARALAWARLDLVRDQIRDQVEAQVEEQLKAHVRSRVRFQVSRSSDWYEAEKQVLDQASSQIEKQVLDHAWARIRDQVEAKVEDHVRSHVWPQVVEQVKFHVGSHVRLQVEDQIRSHVEEDVWSYFWPLVTSVRPQVDRAITGQHDAATFAYHDAFASIGATGIEPVTGLMDVARNAGWWWAMPHTAVLTERPNILHRDRDGRLHHETGPALTYPDGFSIHAWHGTRVPADLIESGWNTQRILTEPNAEIRRCAIERLGWDQLIAEAGLTQIGESVPDPGNPGHTLALYDAPEALYDEPVRVLLCTNGSVERDGTRRKFGLTVPAGIDDPIHAAAWTFGWPVAAYRDLEVRR
ncbi:hypothetical protein OHA61_22250 [Streptomyces sp. NBC_00885]|uniref:DUF6745 domain-containing protein n=1 Tax=Streptomyces sp. NBC_00885 TaxID=2975857 RepID=UPI00386BBE3E|nr:hypothetical protein OHA61_22250 [Streptomyces sp. NBC_00885]